jgi:hypothetical protein
VLNVEGSLLTAKTVMTMMKLKEAFQVMLTAMEKQLTIYKMLEELLNNC